MSLSHTEGMPSSSLKVQRSQLQQRVPRPHSTARRHAPQNGKVFRQTTLPHGGAIHYFAVPGRDGQKAATFFSEDSTLDANSTQRMSYNAHEGVETADSSGLPRRYACSQQPWATATLSNVEQGISPEKYEKKVQQAMATLRRPRTAPAQLGQVGRSTSASALGSRLADDVALIT